VAPGAHGVTRPTGVAASWPAWLTSAVFLGAVGIIALRALRLTHGAWVYPLDDTYIHMSIARTLATHGVWGVTPDGFTSSSSSPLWTLLLAAAFKLFGVHLLLPLWINLVVGVGLIAVLFSMLRATGASARIVAIALIAIMLATPMPALAVVGMEHLLHALLAVLVVRTGVRLAGPAPAPHDGVRVAAFCAALALTRYEGLFLILTLALLLARRRRWRMALVVLVAGAAPVVAYGALSRAHGWYWLPNGVMLKSQMIHGPLRLWLKGMLNNGLSQLWSNPHVLVLVIAALALLLLPRRGPGPGENRDALALFVGAALLHMQFAVAGWFFRYEAYLVCLGLTLIAAGLILERARLRSWIPERSRIAQVAALALLVIFARPQADRAWRSFQEAPRAAANTAAQQVQMARFLGRYYRGNAVVVNDIGAVSFLADVRPFDIWGLASLEPAQLILGHRTGVAATERMTRAAGARVAIVYSHLFQEWGGIPSAWTRVGCWRIPRNVVCAEDSVTIFALLPEEVEPLRGHLREFDGDLPPEVMRAIAGGPACPDPWAKPVGPFAPEVSEFATNSPAGRSGAVPETAARWPQHRVARPVMRRPPDKARPLQLRQVG
jgi:hypothetical protein